MILTAITQTLEVETLSAQDLRFIASWTDIDKSVAVLAVLPGSNHGTVSAITTTQIMAAPAANVYRTLGSCSLNNAGTLQQTVKVKKDVSGTKYPIMTAILEAGDSLHYEDGSGWYVMTAVGVVKNNFTYSASTGLTLSNFAFSIDTSVVTLTDSQSLSNKIFVAPILGTPLSGNLSNCTAFPVAQLSGLATGIATLLGTPSSANLLAAITDETGSGLLVFNTSPTLVTPLLGTPTSGNLQNCTADGTNLVGYRNIPQNSQSAAYTTVLTDAGKHLYHPSADTTARTFTIDSNANVAYPLGTAITFINDSSAGVITISITSDTLVLAGAGTTGSRTLAANGQATAVKMTSTRWQISGVGLT